MMVVFFRNNINRAVRVCSMAGVYTDTVPVVSSNLKAAGWILWGGSWELLEIEFLSGSLYVYTYVPESVYNSLLIAPSKGKYFWQYVRRAGYAYYKLR
jgi:hypothetical protein